RSVDEAQGRGDLAGTQPYRHIHRRARDVDVEHGCHRLQRSLEPGIGEHAHDTDMVVVVENDLVDRLLRGESEVSRRRRVDQDVPAFIERIATAADRHAIQTVRAAIDRQEAPGEQPYAVDLGILGSDHRRVDGKYPGLAGNLDGRYRL